MSRVRLLHWNPSEATRMRDLLLRAGFKVEYDAAFDSALMRSWRSDPPAVFVIDLSRLPARGREIAIALRQSPKTRSTPIVFCGGHPAKVKLIRELLPDAGYCTENELIEAVKTARPLPTAARPADIMNRYGSRSAAQKLGIREGTTIVLISPPRNVDAVLGALPERVEYVEQNAVVTVCFVHSVDDLRDNISRVRPKAAKTKLWIAWRKKTSAHHDGVTEQLVRETGIDLGLVDYKICSLDQNWSAMCFAQRRR